jgi:hypothetical protein
MYFPLMTYTELASGIIMIIAAPYVLYKIYKGSKSAFANVLMIFTFFDGAT